MAKKKGTPDEDPKNLPHDPSPERIDDVVEFLDEADDPVEISFAEEASFDPPEPRASDSAPHVSSHSPRPVGKETDSVLEDELVSFGHSPLDANQVSGIFSSVIRREPESAVLGHSDIIRAEPLSDAEALDPISDVMKFKADSDIRIEDGADEPTAIADDELIDDAVLHDASTDGEGGAVALPESAVTEPIAPHAGEDAIGGEHLPTVNDSSVSIASFHGRRRSVEKEPVLDLDEGLVDGDSPHPVHAEEVQSIDATIAADSGSDDVDLAEILDVEAEGSAVNLGQKPARVAGQSGIDMIAESLESGVRLDRDETKLRPSTPSVVFDDLAPLDTDMDVDLGAEESPKPTRASAKLPKTGPMDPVEVVDEEVSELIDVDDAVPEIAEPATERIDADDIDISAMLDGDAETEIRPVVDDFDETPAVVDDVPVDAMDDVEPAVVEDEPAMVDDEPPVTTPRRGKAPGIAAEAPAPYQEPKKRGGAGSLFGGLALGMLLTAGAGAGVYFLAPDLIPLPDGKKVGPTVENKVPTTASPAMMARQQIDKGEYAAAIETLKDAEGKDAGIRGEARWLAYLKKTIDEKGSIEKDAPDVVTAQKELQDAGDELRLQQLKLALDAASLKAVQDDLKKAGEDKLLAEKSVDDFGKALANAKLLPDGEKFDPAAADKIVKDLSATKDTLDKVNKLLETAKVDGMSDKGVEKLLDAVKDLDGKFAEVNKLLEGEKAKDPGAAGLKEVLAKRDLLAKDREDLDQTLKAAFQELADGKLVPEDGDARKDLLAGAKTARAKSESPLGGPLSSLAGSLASLSLGVGDLVKHSYDDAATVSEINFFRLREVLVPTPDQQLDRLIAALSNRNQTAPVVIDETKKLAEWVLSPEAKSPPTAKAKALFAQGLAQRNQLKFNDARQTLGQAVEILKANETPWTPPVLKAFAEVSDPAAYFIPSIDKLVAEGKNAEALKELDAALVAIPDHPRLIAQRGLLTLGQAKGPLDEKTRTSVRADAEVAARDPKTAASGNFVLGKLEEQDGNLQKAEDFYRQALKAAEGDEQQAGSIRLRLGRLLLRERGFGAAAARPAAPPAPKDEPKEEKKEPEKDAAEALPKLSQVHPLSFLVAAATFGQVAAEEESPEDQARVKEALDIAKQLLASKEKNVQAQGYFLLGEALSRMGQRTEGLRQYAKGIELLFPEAQVTKLLDDHPAFSVPDAALRANPLMAEKHYGIGLHYYYLNQFPEAEAQFKQAIGYFDKDARYFYFLGLSQLEQRGKTKRDAALFAWEQAVRLESAGRPSSREINTALERIQGDRRTYLNAFRARPALAP